MARFVSQHDAVCWCRSIRLGARMSTTDKKRRKWPWVLGGIILVVIIASAVGGNEASNSGGNPSAPVAAPAPEAAQESDMIIYEVVGEGVRQANNITYSNGDPGSMSQANGEALPWSMSVEETGGFMGFYSVTAQSGGQSGSITCRIKQGEEILAENTSTGAYAVVSCNGS